MSTKVAIIGAGLGGLACAIALRKQGFEVQVYEKAKKFRPAGAGLGLLPNGLNSLEAIEPDLVKNIKSFGCCVTKSSLRNTLGEIIRSSPRRDLFWDKYGQPLVTVWWWNLQQILASKLPPDIIHLDHRCLDFQQDEDSVKIYFGNGKTASADLLIGADGINSAVRKKLIADEQPRYLGSFCWRAVVKCDQSFIEPNELVFIRGDKQFMYLLNLGDGNISWITRKLSPEYQLSANAAETKSRVLDEIADWAEPIQAIVQATDAERILEGPICDRLPLSSWSKGRVTLLGDAAHPMSPAMGQGANMTFEDAYALANCLSKSSSIEKAFTNYEKNRLERTKIIQTYSAKREMRYYETDEQKAGRETPPESPTIDEIRQWLYSYKPL
ncbi:MAG: FAD-dependent monooxygenase [Xenococcaceae cyanobacterium MO_167.B52]|nr:FAD-dependent monooxygenase [Xenococcaceae cyanobacterium MO_167.B52]